MGWWLLAAIGSSIVASQILGMLWYGPIFGKLWMAGMGWEKLTKKQMDMKQKEALPGYMLSMLMAAVSTSLLWLLLVVWEFHAKAMSDLSAPAAGALLGLMIWTIGYFGPTIVGRFFEGTDWRVWGISAGYWGALTVLFGTIVGLFSTL